MLEALIGSKLRVKALGYLFRRPEANCYVRQLAQEIGEDSTNLSRELARLATSGILVVTTEGRQKYYRANRQSPIYIELKNLFAKLPEENPRDMLKNRLPVNPALLKAFCREHHVKKLSVFGSVLRGDFTPGSDIDILVEFQPGKIPGLFKLAGMEEELGAILKRKVDLRTPQDLSRQFRNRVLQEAVPLCR